MSEAVESVPSTSAAQDPSRPRMRGWIHLLSALIAIPFGVQMVQHAQEGPMRFGALLYAGSLALLLATSGVYHTPTWSDGPRRILRLLDHSMIFILLGGSYSPFLLGIDADWSRVALPAVWGLVILGILRTLFLPNINRWLKSMIYVVMGWMAVPMMGEFHTAYGTIVLALLLFGGLAFTGGGIIYALKRPNPWPAMFGYHEIFHVGVVVGSVCHYMAVWLVVA